MVFQSRVVLMKRSKHGKREQKSQWNLFCELTKDWSVTNWIVYYATTVHYLCSKSPSLWEQIVFDLQDSLFVREDNGYGNYLEIPKTKEYDESKKKWWEDNLKPYGTKK